MTRSTQSSKGRRRRECRKSFHTYIHRVLKRVHPNIGISKKALDVMNSFVIDTFDKIATEAGGVVSKDKRATLRAREIQTALRLAMPGQLGRFANEEGTTALQAFFRREMLTPEHGWVASDGECTKFFGPDGSERSDVDTSGDAVLESVGGRGWYEVAEAKEEWQKHVPSCFWDSMSPADREHLAKKNIEVMPVVLGGSDRNRKE